MFCHAERSEASPCPLSQTLPLRKLRAAAHCAQGDTPVLHVLVGKNHNRGNTPSLNSRKEDDDMRALYARCCGLDVHADAFRAT